MGVLDQWDPEVAAIIHREEERHRLGLELIASENYASAGVLAALGTVLSTKYAEGYPGKRYYGGCQYVDEVEELAISRAKQLFGADHVNVQPHSGAEANRAVYTALMEVGDVAMGMNLAQGGHLTHGLDVNFSGKTVPLRPLRRRPGDGAPGLRPDGPLWPASTGPRSSWWAPPPIRASSISPAAGRSPTRWGPISWPISPTSPGWWRRACTRRRSRHAHVITTTTHKTLRGPRGGFIMCQADLAQKIDRAVFPGTQGGPHMHSIAAKAVCFGEALKPEFADYQRRIVENARALAEELQRPRPAHRLRRHRQSPDAGGRGGAAAITGRDAQVALEAVGITVNKNTIPYDERPPAVASGLRIGTPAVTSRGMGPDEMRQHRWLHRSHSGQPGRRGGGGGGASRGAGAGRPLPGAGRERPRG